MSDLCTSCGAPWSPGLCGICATEQAAAEVARLRRALEAVREELLEDSEDCDCPPEWPRCVACRVRLNIQVALRGNK